MGKNVTMIASVAPSNRFGDLNGYLIQSGVPPTNEGNGFVNPSKVDTTPGGPVPAPPKIASSAAHPGRKSNNTIPYTRVSSLDAARIAGKPGYCTFVSASMSAHAGMGTERRSLLCGLDFLNDRLKRGERHDYVTSLPNIGKDGKPTNPLIDWHKCSELAEWRLDGVILGNADAVNSNPTHDLIDGDVVITSAINVAIGGIAPAVNVFQAKRGFAEQKAATLDECLILLMVDKSTHSDGYVTFFYECATSSMLYEPTRYFSNNELHAIIGCWRVGKVIDSAAAVGGWPQQNSEHRLTLNVCVEWWDWKILSMHGLPGGVDWSKHDYVIALPCKPSEKDCKSSEKDKQAQPLPPPSQLPTSLESDMAAVEAALISMENDGVRLEIINEAVDTTFTDRSQLEATRQILEPIFNKISQLALSYPSVIRYVRANGPDVPLRVKQWFVTQDRMRRALARGRSL
tara:strand:- start:1636 stop:3009 length:1374 start_codon:yes stop_codon:yes gene_type:complete